MKRKISGLLRSSVKPIGMLNLLVLLSLLVSSASWAATISGTLTNNSGKTGRAYIMLSDYPYGNSTGLGTSIAISAASGTTSFTLSGIPAGQYQLNGYLDSRAGDPLARGHVYSGSPLFGNSTVINTTSGNVSGLNYNMAIPPLPSVVTPSYVNVAPMDRGVFVIFDTPKNGNDIEIAESYNIYWSTSPSPSATQTAGGGSITGIPSIDDGHQGIVGLTNGTAYYVAVEAVLSGAKSGLATTGPIAAGNPAGGYALSGTVNFSGITPTKPLIVIAYSDGGMYLTRITSPTVSQAYTIQGVQPGTYTIGAFLDQNDNRRIDEGDLKTGFDDNMPTTVASNMSLPTMTLINQAVTSRLTTRHTNMGQDDGYFLNFNVADGAKRPTHINITGGPNMGLTSMGINEWGEFDLSYPVPKPSVGDSYSATVYFTDGTNAALSGLTVNGRVDVLPVVTYPMGQTGPDGVSPRFAWYLSGLPAGDYSQNLRLYSQNGNDWRKSVPITQNSYQYDGASLDTGSSYNGEIEISDHYGNVSQSFFQFQPTGNSLQITGVSPTAQACGSTSQITIYGSGFITPAGNNQVYFNSNSTPAVVNSGNATQLSVTLPSCTSSNIPSAATGPIKVTNNNGSAALQGDFTPQVFFDYYVRSSSSSVLPGSVTVSVEGTSITTSSNPADGHFHLSGIPSATPFQLRLSLSGYLPTYSGRMMLFDNYSEAGGFGLLTASEVAALGVTSGKGAIGGRVTNNSGTPMAGVTVSAYSTLHNSSSYYAVAYTSGSTTQPDGKYFVPNVEEGDTVVVSGAYSDYTFNKRTFVTHADAVSQGHLTGTPKVSVSGMSPSTAPTGSSITINGSNFNTEPSQNSVCFPSNMGGTNCTSPTAATSTQLTVSVPCNTADGPVSVISNGQTVSAGTFTVPAPIISGFTPGNGPTNLPVTITGTGFSSGNCASETYVTFAGSYNPSITSTSPTQIVFSTPYVSSTISGTISVTTQRGTATSSGSYTAYPPPFISGSFTPSMAAPGEAVSINGTFYDFNTANYGVTIGGVPAVVASVNAGSLVFTVPGNAGSGGQLIGYYYSQPSYGPTFTVIYRLSAAIAGEGTINSTNGLGGLTCTASSCSANFYYNELASLAATPSSGYIFSGWSGDCGGTENCVMSMTANKSVTATFALQANIKNGSSYYSTLTEALNPTWLVNNDILLIKSRTYIEAPAELVYNNPGVSITLKGGYIDPDFSDNSGSNSIVDGSFKIRGGAVHVQKITIK